MSQFGPIGRRREIIWGAANAPEWEWELLKSFPKVWALCVSGADEMPRIFFSYASEDKFWVKAFRDPAWFGAVGDDVTILDYAAEQVGYGDLNDALNAQIDQSAVVVAFVSASYCKKQWTIAEWEQALSGVQRRCLVFVPIMLDADAKSWWRNLRQKGMLSSLSRDYQYVDFTDGGGKRIEIAPNDTRATGKITQLAIQIKEDLQKPLISAEPPGPTNPEPGAGQRTEEPDNANSASGKYETGGAVDVVVLGHPTAALPPDLVDHIHKLCAALASVEIRAQVWGDGWRKNAGARGRIGTADNIVFIQPVPPGEASDRVKDQGAIGTYLEEATVRHANVVLWLPQAFRDPDFEAATRTAAASGQFPVARNDGYDQLAEWLRGLKNKDQPADETRIQVQTMGFSEETSPEQAIISRKIVQQLQDQISSIAEKLVDNPRPTPPPWQFWDSQFNRQIRLFPGSRTIVAIHDLDVCPGEERAVEKQLQIKFDTIQKALDEEQESRVKTGKPPLNTFLTALLVNNGEALPFGNYPGDGRYGRWCLLGFAPPGDATRGETPPLNPDPASLAVFKTNLLAWAHSPC